MWVEGCTSETLFVLMKIVKLCQLYRFEQSNAMEYSFSIKKALHCISKTKLQLIFKESALGRVCGKTVSKILEENSFKGFGGNQFQRFWSKFVSKILEENSFKDFGGKLFQRFWRKIVSKILEENCVKDFGGYFFFKDKSRNFSKIVLVLLYALVKRFFVSRINPS